VLSRVFVDVLLADLIQELFENRESRLPQGNDNANARYHGRRYQLSSQALFKTAQP